jgi:hypothetical protein
MTKIVVPAIQKASSSTAVRKFVRGVFTFDPAATRMLDDTYVQVHLSSRIWMV